MPNNKVTIVGIAATNLMTFRTNAGFNQRVRITGSGITRDVIWEGSGNRIHRQNYVGRGVWEIEGWYKPYNSKEWIPSAARGTQSSANFNDGGSDDDFDDAQVLVTPVSISALKAAASYLEQSRIIDDEDEVAVSIQGFEEP